MGPTTNYEKVPLKLLRKFSHFEKDLYVKLSTEKYVKVFNGKENSNLFKESLIHFQERSFEHLYCDYNGKNEASGPLSVELSSFFVEVSSYFEKVNDEIDSLSELVGLCGTSKMTLDTIKRSVLSQKLKIKSHLSRINCERVNNYYLEHSILTAIFALEFLNCFEKQNDLESKRLLASASLLHDISLFDKKPYFIGNAISDLGSLEVHDEFNDKDFLEHTRKSAMITKQMGFSDRKLMKIIFLHHERPLRKGFPSQIALSVDNFLPLIFTLAHDAVRFLYINNFDEYSLNEMFHYIQSKNSGDKKVEDLLETIRIGLSANLLN